MRFECCCGRPLSSRFWEVSCLECGAPCCPGCTFIFEWATYCVLCAETILGLTVTQRGAVTDVLRG
jgi:hypothetical protein